MNFRIAAIPEETARKVRETMKSAQYGHPAFTDLAKGYGPCRLCLKTFDIGKEDRILFTYNAFEGLSELPLPSPIYIHKDECERYEAEGFPADLRELPIALEGYGKASYLHAREKVNSQTIEQTIEQLFANPEVEYIHIRNTEAVCFMARIEREEN